MNDLLPPPNTQLVEPTPIIDASSPAPDRTGSWIAATVAAIALDVLAVFVRLVGLIVWLGLLWNGSVEESLALPLLAACSAPAIACWVGSGWVAARLAADRRGWWLLAAAPFVAAASYMTLVVA